MPGYVYVLVNDATPGLVKIGSSEDPERRARELSGHTAVPTSFKVAHAEKLQQYWREAEQEVHRRLAAARVTSNREFFRIAPEDAIAVVRDVAQSFRERERREIGALPHAAGGWLVGCLVAIVVAPLCFIGLVAWAAALMAHWLVLFFSRLLRQPAGPYLLAWLPVGVWLLVCIVVTVLTRF